MEQVLALADPQHLQQFAFPFLQKICHLSSLTNDEIPFVQACTNRGVCSGAVVRSSLKVAPTTMSF